MSDSYQAVYDATRSRISSVGSDVVERAAREAFDISFQKEHLQQEIYHVSGEMTRPSVLFRPTISADGDKWCALLGEDLQVGIAGFGDTPQEAMIAFDREFLTGKTPTAIRLAREQGA